MNFNLNPELNYLNKSYSLKERMNFYGVAGLSLSIVKKFKIDSLYQYGFKNINTNEKVNKNTIFQAASISKPIACSVLFKIIEKGLLDLDVDVNVYLKDFRVKDLDGNIRKVTLRELLTHTGGITIGGFPGYSRYEKIPNILQILTGDNISNTQAIMAGLEKGKYSYSGGGYTIIEKIIEDITGKKFEQIAEKELFNKLDLKLTTYKTLYNNKNCSSAYRHKKRILGKYYIYPEKAAAGLWSNPEELTIIFLELLRTYNNLESRNIFTKIELEEIFTPIFDCEVSRGLGFRITKIGDNKYIRHTGWNEGFRSHFIFNLEKGFGFVIMTNGDNGYELIKELSVSIAKENYWNDMNEYRFY